MKRWYLGSMNDGRFIIDTPPRPSNELALEDIRRCAAEQTGQVTHAGG